MTKRYSQHSPDSSPFKPGTGMEFTVVFDANMIRRRVREMALQISADYAGQDIVLVGLLNGAVFLLTDLAREIENFRIHPPAGDDKVGVKSCRIDFMRLGSYEGQKSTGRVKVDFDVQNSVEGKHVIIVDEVAETLHTTHFVVEHRGHKHPASVRVCVLLTKPDCHERDDIELHYVGFSEPDLPFLKGYGMDDDQKERGLPFIAECPPPDDSEQ